MRRGSILSEEAKMEIARELGVANIVEKEGWGGVSSRNCGNVVRKAIEIANEAMKNK